MMTMSTVSVWMGHGKERLKKDEREKRNLSSGARGGKEARGVLTDLAGEL